MNNAKIIAILKNGANLLEKAETFPKTSDEGHCEVHFESNWEVSGYFTMVTPFYVNGGDYDIIDGEVIPVSESYSIEEYHAVKKAWIPLPVLLDELGMDKDMLGGRDTAYSDNKKIKMELSVKSLMFRALTKVFSEEEALSMVKGGCLNNKNPRQLNALGISLCEIMP